MTDETQGVYSGRLNVAGDTIRQISMPLFHEPWPDASLGGLLTLTRQTAGRIAVCAEDWWDYTRWCDERNLSGRDRDRCLIPVEPRRLDVLRGTAVIGWYRTCRFESVPIRREIEELVASRLMSTESRRIMLGTVGFGRPWPDTTGPHR